MPNLIGSTLGPYRILEQIGLGGMATVYKAYQPGTERLVALKVMPDHYAHNPHFVQRFEQEARIIAKLEHRNIVPVFDFGTQDGTTYLVMRYLQAGTVKDILERGALSLADAAKIIGDVAAALGYAHEQGIIHRDVKPSNILVDKDGNAYLMDFGIAKVLEGTANLTGSAMLGTPAYMAPEQTLNRPVTAQTDVYSLGVMLYEMVTGRQPFEAETPMAVALKHVHDSLPPPRHLKPDLPDEVELVILKALAKDPADRYQSAGDLARAFSNAVQATATTTTETGLTELAESAAQGKGEEHITGAVRSQIRRQEATERIKRLMRRAPLAVGEVVLFALASGLFYSMQQGNIRQTQAAATEKAVAQLMAEATRIAGLPTETPVPTATLDLDAIAKTQTVQTQTQQAIEQATLAAVQARATASQSALETIIALTPTATPLVTATPTVAPTPTLRANLTGIWKIYGRGTTTGCTDAAPPPMPNQTGSNNNGPSNFQLIYNVVHSGASISASPSVYLGQALSTGLTGSVSGDTVSFQIINLSNNYQPNITAFSGTWGYNPDPNIPPEDVLIGTYSGGDTAGYGCQYSGSFIVYFGGS